jgi:hypothetical protein
MLGKARQELPDGGKGCLPPSDSGFGLLKIYILFQWLGHIPVVARNSH